MEGRWIDLDNVVWNFFNNRLMMETLVDLLVCAVPIWGAVMVGLLIGWSWRPRWTSLLFLGFRSKFRFIYTASMAFGARRFWFAFTALSAFSVCRQLWFSFRSRSRKEGEESGEELDDSITNLAPGMTAASAVAEESNDLVYSCRCDIKPATCTPDGGPSGITEKDLRHLLHLLDWKDGEMAWQIIMERSTSNFSYQAWRHEPDTGPIVYRSKTVFEDATMELVRDFFWDDEFRSKWDPMLSYFKILEECPHTGMMIVHWIKKFPFFCSDREYIFGRRIWEAGRTYYCVTKQVPSSTLPRSDKPRRVDLCFASWVIRPAPSLKGDGHFSACEVIYLHYEEMGIPKDVAKFGVRHGMWGTVKKLHAGFRAYQNSRSSELSPTRFARMAGITTKLAYEGMENDSEGRFSGQNEEKIKAVGCERHKDCGGIDWRWFAIGGTVAVVCGLRMGLIGRAFLIGAGHRIARRKNCR
ncbi:uncharacterized protein [Primulina huaijiensis]|uniref:uncharacterized protein n=1 Tax=Primulina huaijiensis TaxID=1492673 RepID=UPI003CC77BFE